MNRVNHQRRGGKRNQTAALLQQEHELFEGGPVVVFQWQNQANWPVEYVSANVQDMLGYSVEEFAQGQVLYANLIHPADVERVAAEVFAASRNTPTRFEHQPYRLIRRSGEIIWVLDHTTIRRDASGLITHYLGYLVNITTLKNTEEALRESQERLELALRGAELGTWDWNIQTGEVFFNERWANMLGYAPDELEPHVNSWRQLMHPDEESTIMRTLDTHLAGRSTLYRAEQRLRTKSGEWKWILDTGKVITRDEHGRPLRAAGVHLDIEQHKQVENALRCNEAQLREAQNLAQLGSWDLDLITRTVTWSAEVYRIFGTQPNTFTPTVEAVEAFVHPDDRADFRSHRATMFAETAPSIFDHRIIRPDGELRHVQVRAQATVNSCGKPIRVTGTVQDITVRKQMEDTLRQNEAQLRALIDHAPLSIVSMDPAGKVLIWNNAAERIYGWTAAEALGQRMPAVPPDRQTQFDEFLVQLYQGRSIDYSEVPGVRKDGTHIQLALAGAPLRNATGQVTALLGMAADITEHKHAEELVRQHNNFLTALYETTLDLLNRREIADLLPTIVERAAAILDAPISELMLKDGDELVVHACTIDHPALKGDRSRREEARLSWQAHDTRQPVTLKDYATWPERRSLYDGLELHAVADFPIMAGDDCVGVLALGRTQPDRPFTPDEIQQGRLFSQLAALVLDNANLYNRARRELTERTQAETALRQNEEKYRTLVETLSEGVALNELIYDEHGDAIDYRILEVNPAFHAVANYAGPIVGQLATEIYGLPRDYITAFWRSHRDATVTQFTELAGPLNDRYYFIATSPIVNDRFVTSFFDITERRRAEEALRDSNTQYRIQSQRLAALITNLPEGVLIETPQRGVQHVNQNFCNLFGLNVPPAALIGADCRLAALQIKDLFVHSEDFLASIETALNSGGRVLNQELALRDGRVFERDYIPVEIGPAQHEHVWLYRDITARKQADHALRESQSLYHSLVEVSPLCICRKDQDGRFTFANRRFLEETQTTLDDLIGKTDYDLHPLDLAEKYRTDDRAVMASGQVTELIEERSLSDGTAVSAVQSVKTPIYDGAGQISGVQISFWDITERLRIAAAEREQRTLAEALRDTAAAVNSTLDLNEVFDRILASVERVIPHDAANVMLIDEHGQARIVRHRGFQPHGLQPQVEEVRFQVNEVANLHHMFTTGRPLAIPDTRLYPAWINLPDLHPTVSHVGAPLRVKDRVIGFLNADSSTVNFYTDKHAERLQVFAEQVAMAVENARLYEQVQRHSQQLEARVRERTIELVAANERLTELDRLKDEFLSRTTHELRTPLAAIKLYLGLLDKGRPERREAYLQTLRQEADRLNTLIEDVLTFAQINRHTPAANVEPIELRPWLNEQRAHWERLSSSRGLAFRLTLAPDTPCVRANDELLIQALNRLVINAVNYTAAGQITVTSAAYKVNDRCWAVIKVQDTGPGIAPDELPRIFQRFYRGRAASNFKTPGVGVGLSISHEIAEKLGGRLTVETQLGAGSTFTLWLPAAAQ